jgi:hypothetical protein
MTALDDGGQGAVLYDLARHRHEVFHARFVDDASGPSPQAEGGSVSDRQVVLRRGRHVGWWVEGRSGGGRLFMKTWWPTQGLARAVARLVGGRVDPGG